MSSDTGPATPALAVEELVAGYGGVIALDRVSISAGTAAITAVLGANGAAAWSGPGAGASGWTGPT